MADKIHTHTLIGIDGISPKVPMDFMEFPIFHPSKDVLKDTLEWEYVSSINKKKRLVTITASPTICGRPNIYDLDLIMFFTSQILFLNDRGTRLSGWLRFHPNKYFEFAGKSNAGSKYQCVQKSLGRLCGTLISTNIYSENFECKKEFHIIEEWGCVRNTRTGRLSHIKVKPSEWLYDLILSTDVKTIDSSYFKISSPFIRRLTLIFTKHLGKKHVFNIGVEKLFKKHGSGGKIKNFRHKLKQLNNDEGNGFKFKILVNKSVDVRRKSEFL